jgi:hypothetical protein
MKNKTELEFLIKEFSDILGPLDTKPMQDLLLADAMKQAKSIAKMESEKTWIAGVEYSLLFLKDKTSKTSKEAFDEYYNETFKSKQ